MRNFPLSKWIYRGVKSREKPSLFCYSVCLATLVTSYIFLNFFPPRKTVALNKSQGAEVWNFSLWLNKQSYHYLGRHLPSCRWISIPFVLHELSNLAHRTHRLLLTGIRCRRNEKASSVFLPLSFTPIPLPCAVTKSQIPVLLACCSFSASYFAGTVSMRNSFVVKYNVGYWSLSHAC